jgi:methylated-DNA-[protein]-cysteine S-methyltransferase
MSLKASHRLDSTDGKVWTLYKTPLGLVRVGLNEHAITRLSFPELDGLHLEGLPQIECPDALARALDSFFVPGPLDLPYPLEPHGTPFQRDVWEMLRQIPVGHTETYGAIAQKLHRPFAARAVGQACGANPIPLFIPCHRVVSAQGIGGFSLGLELKIKLFEIESILQ